jgi:hypothetical protein
VDDRFYWVKEGIKFLILGTTRNQTVPILFHDVGEFVQSKMGVSDEKKFFREFFVRDPDPRFKTTAGEPGPDRTINPDGKDSYLVAYDWFVRANEKDDNDGVIGVKGKTHVFFRQGPARALLYFAKTRAEKGLFDEHIPAWDRAYKSWMDDYGKMDFLGLDDKKYRLNCTEDELKALAEENGVTLQEQRRIWAQNLDMTNFRQWRDIADLERTPEMLEARRMSFEGKKAYNEGRNSDTMLPDKTVQISDSQKSLEAAMTQWAKLAEKYPNMFIDGDNVEDCLLLIQYYRVVCQLNLRNMPDTYPLKDIWDKNPSRHPDAERNFLIETRLQQRK